MISDQLTSCNSGRLRRMVVSYLPSVSSIKGWQSYDPRDPFHILQTIRLQKRGLACHWYFVVCLCGFNTGLSGQRRMGRKRR